MMHEVYNSAIPRSEKKIHWQKLIESWQKSHWSMQEFCRHEQIKITDLKRWRYRLGRVNKNDIKTPVSKPVPGFTPLQLIAEVSKPISGEDNFIELTVNHYRIRLGAFFSEQTLLRLIQVLQRMSSC